MKNKLYVVMTVGLPACGKTTWAKEWVANHPRWKRINKDDMRELYDGGVFSKENEKMVLAMRDLFILECLKNDFNVIVDDTNFEEKHKKAIETIVDDFLYSNINKEVEIIEQHFNFVSLSTCITRDSKRIKPVGEDVIYGMYEKYYLNKKEDLVDGLQPYEESLQWKINGHYHNDDSLAQAIICDIDGTLANKSPERGIYEFDKVHLDTLVEPVRKILRQFKESHTIFIMSGREDSCREETDKWIKDNVLSSGEYVLLMRKAGDRRNDTVIKKELFNEHIRSKFFVSFVMDDRPMVVRMWRKELGLFVLDANQNPEKGEF